MNRKQIPQLINKNKNDIIFSQQNYYFTLFDFAQLKSFSLYTYSELQKIYRILKENIRTSFTQAYYSLGCAFLEKEEYEDANEALQIAMSISQVQNTKIIYSQAISQLQIKLYRESLSSLQLYTQLIPESRRSLENNIKKIKAFSNGQKYALLVGINNYINLEMPNIKGAINDVLALKKVLLEKLKFKEENITILLDEQATNVAILESFKQLIKDSETGPAIFYFAGAGSEKDETLSIVSVDSRLEGVYDIRLKELSYLSSNSNLVTIIDAGWNIGGSRTAPKDERKRPTSRGIGFTPRNIYKEDELNLKIGELTIYSPSMKSLKSFFLLHNELEVPSFENYDNKVYHGELTYAIIKTFIENDINNMTYSKLIDLISTVKPKIIFDKEDALVFSNSKLVNKVTKSLKTIEKLQVINKAIFLLQRLIERRNDIYPEGYLNLGIAYAAKGDYDNGIKSIERAIVQKDNFYLEASYYLGKFLFERGKEFAKAVAILREVIKHEPNNNPAHYYLGQSIRSLIEKETLLEAERSLRTYLENGAEIGHEVSVWEFINSIEEKKQSIKV
ncbi:MAG TPA: tetratricopeptide repeat protein [Nitrososphaeraceae archaeon]|nr:tetratricopeptide repeat protein [Nitrososphaeraceae archaeon]